MIALALAATLLNAEVNQGSLAATICHAGYSAHYRRTHLVHVPTRHGFTRDHIVPIELGGNSNRANIQFQTKPDALRKDREEGRLHRATCSGRMTLREAQEVMERWR